MEKLAIALEGNVDDLLMVNHQLKSTRLINVTENTDYNNDEIIDLSITSSCLANNHPFFDSLIGKKIKIKVYTIED